jgi:hypothetical protein
MTIIKDPIYRYYNSNIQCPNIKTEKLTCKQADIASLGNTVSTLNGSMPLSSRFIIDSVEFPILLQKNIAGELTLYLKNDALNVCNVSTSILIKTNNVITNADYYQKVGNLTTQTISISGNTLVVTVSPAATLYWVFRGI